jgi:hypothetical protein
VQEQYEIVRFELLKILVSQAFPAEETTKGLDHFESASLRPLRYISMS